MGTAPDRGSLGDVPEDTIGATLEQVREGTLHQTLDVSSNRHITMVLSVSGASSIILK